MSERIVARIPVQRWVGAGTGTVNVTGTMVLVVVVVLALDILTTFQNAAQCSVNTAHPPTLALHTGQHKYFVVKWLSS